MPNFFTKHWILIVIIIIVIIGIVGFFIYKKKSDAAATAAVNTAIQNTKQTSSTSYDTTFVQVQNLINSTLPGGSDAGFSTQLKGMSIDNAKKFIFKAVIQGNGIDPAAAGTYDLYQYPAIELAVLNGGIRFIF